VHCVANCMESQLRLEIVAGSLGLMNELTEADLTRMLCEKGACKYKSCIHQELLRRAAKELIPSTGILKS